MFFFAGHGIDLAKGEDAGELVLALTSTSTGDLDAIDHDAIRSSALPWSDVAKAMGEARGSVVVVLDACNSGAAGRVANATSDAVVETLFTTSGAPMVVLAASKGKQNSNEDAEGGFFTSAIAAAITTKRRATDTDGNGVIDLRELYRAVKLPVAAAAHKVQLADPDREHEQTPWLARNALVGEMSLF